MRISLVLLRAALQSCNRNRRRRTAVVSSITGGWLQDLPNGWQGKLP